MLVFGAQPGNIGEAVADLAKRSEAAFGYPVLTPPQEVVDVTDFDQLHAYIRDNRSRILEDPRVVYSAGVNYLHWLDSEQAKDSTDWNEVEHTYAVNVIGFEKLMTALTYVFEPSEHEMSIVAVSSDAGRRPMRTSASYCGSKSALDMVIKVAARELGPNSWRINGVAPGMVSSTPMSRQVDRYVPLIRGWTPMEAYKYEKSQAVQPRRVSRHEVAAVIVSTLNGPFHLNGSIIEINGGR